MARATDSPAGERDDEAAAALTVARPDHVPAPVATEPSVAEPPSFAASFAAAEQAALAFLVGEEGFYREEQEVGRAGSEGGVFGRAVYRSAASGKGSSRTVTLTIAPLRLELDLELARTGEVPCRIEELHALEGRGAFPGRQHGLYDAMHEPEQLAAEFRRLAGVLRACGARFFDDDRYLWEDLEAKRERLADDEKVRRTLARSKECFRAREWQQVIELLAPISHRLGSTASVRLAYAKRKARQGG